MKRRILPAANGAAGAIIVGLSLFGLSQARNVSDRHSALLFIGFGALFLLVSYGLSNRSRPLVTLASLPLVLASVAASFVLLWAPLAWGDSNMGTVVLVQILSVAVAVLQIASLRNAFAASREREGEENA